MTPADLRDLYEERAAIREYDGGQPRRIAEREARREAYQAGRAAGLTDDKISKVLQA